MKFCTLIVFRFVCLLLMIHLLAINIRDDYYLSFTKCSNISKEFDIDEESKTKSKSSENSIADDSIDEFLENYSTNNKSKIVFTIDVNTEKNSFQYLISAFPKVHYEIQIPPPRA